MLGGGRKLGINVTIGDDIGYCGSNLNMSANFSPYENIGQYDGGDIMKRGVTASPLLTSEQLCALSCRRDKDK
jgi:hypothetical protein